MSNTGHGVKALRLENVKAPIPTTRSKRPVLSTLAALLREGGLPASFWQEFRAG